MHYRVEPDPTFSNFFQITWTFNCDAVSELEIRLPIWRPGRYERMDYNKNVKSLVAYLDRQELSIERSGTDSWVIQGVAATGEIKVNYSFYAARWDGGGCWTSDDIFYMNGVNCLMYIEGRQLESCTMELDLPLSFEVACGLKLDGGMYLADNFDELVDCPVLAGSDLKMISFKESGVEHKLWFYCEGEPPAQKILSHFRAYTKAQLEVFGDFPVSEYHYLILITQGSSYHGVEHRNSTVIQLGPEKEVFCGKRYVDLLGVCSHELFHTWNVKNIRPKSMLPYDFGKENFSRLGYVYEGFTTYYGDLMLARSGVFDKAQYFLEINTYLERHLLNYGRFNLSVAESSFSTWVDGYGAGIPGRKTSIYMEGALNAMILDLKMRKDGSSLDELMRRLYVEFGKKELGYERKDLERLTSDLCGREYATHYEAYYYTARELSEPLNEELRAVGCRLVDAPHLNSLARCFGFMHSSRGVISSIAPGSPAALASLAIGDELEAVNGCKLGGLAGMDFSEEKALDLTVLNFNKKRSQVLLKAQPKNHFFSLKKIVDLAQISDEQALAFKKWSGLIHSPKTVLS